MIFNNEWNIDDTADITNCTIAEKILYSRNIKDIEKYLYPKLEHMHNPFLFEYMEKAVNRILEAVKNKEGILIYGDYDTDGITATAIIYKYLLQNTANITYFIPDRKKDGYGLSIDTLEEILNEEIGLVITVDCGITAVDEVSYMNDLGIDCIITDHHTPLDELPDAYCIITSKLNNCLYPFKHLCGAGIAFKLIHAICITLGQGYEYAKYIDLAALGTIADMVPLIEENRVIAKIGMDLLSKSENIGIRSLISKSYPNGIDKINSSQLLFNIIPKLNASGRMDSAEHSIRLLITDDLFECDMLSLNLIELNESRQVLQREITEQVFREIDENSEIKNCKILVLSNEKWDRGVLGIVASSIIEKYNKPCILMEILEDGSAKGSARSVGGFNIIKAIDYCKDFLSSYGGHKMAAGLTIKKDNSSNNEKIKEFAKMINQYADDIKFEVKDNKTICPDFIIDINDLTLKNAELMSLMEPFGCENELSLLMLKEIEVHEHKLVGKNKDHLHIKFTKNQKLISTILFRGEAYEKLLIPNQKYDIIFKLSCNTVKDSNSKSLSIRKFINCEVVDIRFSDIKQNLINELIKYTTTSISIDRNNIADLYNTIINKSVPCEFNLNELTNVSTFLICLDILKELGIIEYNNINFQKIFVTKLNNSEKKDLMKSKTYIKVT
ncbi:MAG TPA: single-stranded-DNA-specific exonuclease RecJ [Clostridia bacterium]|nr:single-stranded-DNA-specific exonuclease RecJ [Clostridia bacterium]